MHKVCIQSHVDYMMRVFLCIKYVYNHIGLHGESFIMHKVYKQSHVDYMMRVLMRKVCIQSHECYMIRFFFMREVCIQ